jgi:hypothetical protein
LLERSRERSNRKGMSSTSSPKSMKETRACQNKTKAKGTRQATRN